MDIQGNIMERRGVTEWGIIRRLPRKDRGGMRPVLTQWHPSSHAVGQLLAHHLPAIQLGSVHHKAAIANGMHGALLFS